MRNRFREAVNQKELAVALGMTQSTISRALRGQAGVSRRVRDEVLKAARQAGYELPEWHGQRPRKVLKQKLICVDIPHGDEWHERLISGVITACAEFNSEVLISPHTVGELPQVVVRGQVDGLIRLMSQSDYRAERPVSPASVPTVSVLFPVQGADVVSVDHFGTACALGRHLGRLNPSIVAYVGHSELIGRARYFGTLCGMEEHGAVLPPELVVITDNLEPVLVMPHVERLLARRETGGARDRFDLIVFYNDHLARHAIELIRSKGLRVPEDIGVAGYDDAALPLAVDLSLATVHLPIEELGEMAVRRLYRRMGFPNDPPLHIILDAPVKAGSSVIQR